MKLIGQLVNEATGGPLSGFNVSCYVCGPDETFEPVGHATTEHDGFFSLHFGRWDAEPPQPSLRLRFEVLDRSLELIHRTEHEVGTAPDSVLNTTLAVPNVSERQAEETAPLSDERVAEIRVTPHEVSLALGARDIGSRSARSGWCASGRGAIRVARGRRGSAQCPCLLGRRVRGPNAGRVRAHRKRRGARGVSDRDRWRPSHGANLGAGRSRPRARGWRCWSEVDGRQRLRRSRPNRVGRPPTVLGLTDLGHAAGRERGAMLREAQTVGSANYTSPSPFCVGGPRERCAP